MPHSFPLEKVTRGQLRQFAQFLWSWPTCDDCNNGQTCAAEHCPYHRLNRLEPFFDYYKNLTASYDPDIRTGEQTALTTHRDLLSIMQKLRLHTTIPRAQLLDTIFAEHGRQKPVPKLDQEHALDLAIKAMLMINCSVQHRSPALLEHGAYAVPWLGTVSLSDFVTNNFPTSDHPNINDLGDDGNKGTNLRTALMARKLKKRAGIKFRPTDDLKSHLKLDRRSGIVDVYHHTAFLKEHLRFTRDKSRNTAIVDSLKFGVLPRQIALEVLDSIQKILFPMNDTKSRAFLGSLISKSGFDPDTSRFESVEIRTAEEKNISYYYFGARLSELFDELQNPTPRGMEKWFERKSGARYVMMATLVGVAIAVLLGIASLTVSSYQAWLGYQQWQHPVSSG
ncbi:hypothetical protein B0O99DRAFT_39470 [Bisporella sp. PMI_857]|nr:hypothetical protein B0O99DRAFT_39470 [Bisporella sp. PMI_857]